MSGWRFAHPAFLAVLPAIPLIVLLLETRLGGGIHAIATRTFARSLGLALVVVALAAPRERSTVTLPPRLVVSVAPLAPAASAGRREASAVRDAALAAAARQGAPALVRAAPERVDDALREAAAAFPTGERGGVLLVTDGIAGLNEARDVATALRARGLLVGYVAVPSRAEEPPPRPRILELAVPPIARGTFRARARVVAPPGTPARFEVDGRVLGEFVVPDSDGDAVLACDVPSLDEGYREIALVLAGPEGDAEERARQIVTVPAPPRFAAGFANAGRSWFARAAAAQGIAFEPFVAGTEPALDADGFAFDAEFLAHLDPATAELIATAIRNGKGLALEAGASDAAWAALAEGPFAPLLGLTPQETPAEPEPVPEPAAPQPTPPPPPTPPRPLDEPGIAAERAPDEALPITLLLLIDRSGSMEGEKFQMALEAAHGAAQALGAADRLGAIVFAEEARVVLAPRAGRPDLRLALGLVEPDGSQTNIHAALAKAGEVLASETGRIRHVLLITDGEQYPPGPLFSGVMGPLRASGVTVTAIGIGRHARMAQLREIVRLAAGGRELWVPTPSDVPIVVTRDTRGLADARGERVARLPDPRREPVPDPEAPPAPAPPPTEAPPTPRPVPKPPAPPVRLRIRSPHEALQGFTDATWPEVGEPRRAVVHGDARVLLERADAAAAPTLVASRPGLGRCASFLLPPGDPSWGTWPRGTALLGQVLASVVAPEGTATSVPHLSLATPHEGPPTLAVAWPEGLRGRLEIAVAIDGGPLRPVAAGGPTREPATIALPGDLAPGSHLRIEASFEGRALPALERVLPPRPIEAVAAADSAGLHAALGPAVDSPAEFVASLPEGERRRDVPRWPWPLGAALVWLVADVAVHRRRSIA